MACTEPDEMEMPVQCRCGKWMELNDSRLPPGEREGETVCGECYDDAAHKCKCPADYPREPFGSGHNDWCPASPRYVGGGRADGV